MDCGLLEDRGFVVLKGLVSKAACARARALIDSTFGPKGESAAEHIHAHGGVISHHVKARAPADDSAFWGSCGPFLQSNNFYHDMRHPIRSPVAAECIPPALVAAMEAVLRSTDVKLSQQYWVRTDYSPPPYNDHPGMHLDHACLPWQREATPQQTNYLCQVALADIPPGGAATLVSPAAFRRAKATAAQLQREEPEWCATLRDEEFRTTLTGRCGEQPAHDELVEVVMEEGDVAIMDPMMMHTATPMRHPGQSRYVAYSTFFDASAAGPVLLPTRGATEPSQKYPPDFVSGLAANGLEGLVDWEVPEATDTQSRRMRAEWGLASRM
jgi:hypothetical protein